MDRYSRGWIVIIPSSEYVREGELQHMYIHRGVFIFESLVSNRQDPYFSESLLRDRETVSEPRPVTCILERKTG